MLNDNDITIQLLLDIVGIKLNYHNPKLFYFIITISLASYKDARDYLFSYFI